MKGGFKAIIDYNALIMNLINMLLNAIEAVQEDVFWFIINEYDRQV